MNSAARTVARRQGILWCATSIVLVSLAQLALKWAVRQLPPLSPEDILRVLAQSAPLPLTLLFAGLSGYALSMLCWFFALRRLPLSYAYPMLSISYVLVYLLAAALPCFAEPVTTLKTGGMILILIGVLLIHTGRKETR